MITTILAWIAWLALVIVGAVIGQDARTLVPRLSRHLLTRAAQRIDHEYAADLLEEWLAHADELELLVQKLAHAGSIYLYGAGRIAREFDKSREVRSSYLRMKWIIELLVAIFALPALIFPAPLILLFLRARVKPFRTIPVWGRDGQVVHLLHFNTRDLSQHYPHWASFIQKCSLDFIPVLWNVFRGELSLVGPAPRSIDQECDYAGLKPGLIPLPPEELSHYAQNASLSYDLRLVSRTCLEVLSPQDRQRH